MIRLPRSYSGHIAPETIDAQLKITNRILTTRVSDIVVDTNVISKPAASIATTIVYTTRLEEAGVYDVSLRLVTIVAGTGGTANATFSWNNGHGGHTYGTSNISLSVLGDEQGIDQEFYSGGGQIMSYFTTVAGATGSPAYALYHRVLFRR